ncbi:hypothetical protein [Pseudomonas huaxiensis]|uniref:hypothetical protein n=1 Tax=Pseudomonas huaxiensis TaxID=2213017 RepID=UPI000DA6A38E|nr:hypothetical protein [Pseudomonas huaxiensis]
MSNHIVPLANVMRLQQVLENGGTATCQVRRPESLSIATIQAKLETDAVHLEVAVGDTTGKLTLQRGDTAKYQHLRDFIQELANGRTEYVKKALALMDAHDHVSAILPSGHLVYISPTPWPNTPFAAVITNNTGEICAVACGADKDNLAAQVRAKLWPSAEGHGECA